MTELTRFTVTELCQVVEISQDDLYEIVGLGVISPLDAEAIWLFDYQALSALRRARRLRIELDLEWAGTAMVLTLLEKIDRLEHDNAQLRRQLDRLLQV
ncbi:MULTISPECIES: chaperone modulator CbpM [unclassified Erwinia]|uniref:chaperone modulator CbpM n=1 Tax=unclassified Erwinia TaxID=2622719 RepID=UPI0008339448|nr:chaperone modulator CbpM [Erwinia sp. ErVv1]